MPVFAPISYTSAGIAPTSKFGPRLFQRHRRNVGFLLRRIRGDIACAHGLGELRVKHLVEILTSQRLLSFLYRAPPNLLMNPKGVGHAGFCLPLLTIHISVVRNEYLSRISP